MGDIQKINNISGRKPKILVAPLDWGLGHATRCIPIIKILVNNECEVIVASAGPQMSLLKQEFPYLRFVPLPGYGLQYGQNKWLTHIKVILQIPRILIQIIRENRWLRSFLERESLDAVISDNRYGLYSSSLVSVFITHQLHIETPFGSAIEKKLQEINYRFINRFSFCWIPDFETNPVLSGKLAHPEKLPVKAIRYLGPLTRFDRFPNLPTAIDLLVLLSGPEPQRTLLEKKLLAELVHFQGGSVLVRGLPGRTDGLAGLSNLKVYNHLPADTMNRIIGESKYVLCRSGYSSIMDMVILGKKCIMIPTPGQSEQIYLAKFLSEQGFVYSVGQDEFTLKESFEAAEKFQFVKFENREGSSILKAVTEMMMAMGSGNSH